MRTLERNKQPIYYALYQNKVPIMDEYGNETGQYQIIYSVPVLLRANVSAAAGEKSIQPFGEQVNYDKVIVLDDIDCPITETSVLWIDTAAINEPHNYIVKKIAKSLNSVLIAVSKVNVGA